LAGQDVPKFDLFAVKLPHHFADRRSKRFSLLLTTLAAILLNQGQAQAALTYNIYESGGDVVVQASGTLNLPTSIGSSDCLSNGGISSANAIICTGPVTVVNLYSITGSTFFDGSVYNGNGTSTSSTSTYLIGSPGFLSPGFGVSPDYVSGTPIISSSIFSGETLASLGFTINSGLLGAWILDGTNDTINACLGAAPCASAPATPGPLPLLGAGAALGWSRRLRKRVASPALPSSRA
jgi:MYXO-CTERM domain-containing protein